jgi:hypothetical protein
VSTGDSAVELGDFIGSSSGSTQRLTLYIPTEDRDGRPIPDRETWFQRGIELLTQVGGGATVMPCRGAWYNSRSGNIIQENIDVVYTFVKARGFQQNRASLRKFLHALGIATNQGEVAFEFDGCFYRIDRFEP